ncbi:hypothetical protein C2869_01270 [Saccharobesus litoralis]|uniref:Uncharacterized protein n=1 Tax=Saccharobesus litoralis TaxID=2172099 RepID=A0A2S0VLS2_9ALTE|nr:hypothetical protein [Saccharobesus litoralis]AWB65156.1 hypothetical protein C2869_01270 [Saccharobesus litoralis]
MKFTWKFSDQFAKEFTSFPDDYRNSVVDFITTYQDYGLSDFSKYEGKIAPSWSGNGSEEDKKYAKENHLWHYHVGLPEYEQLHDSYKTSDYLLHFQWKFKGNDISIVDMYRHYKIDGSFYLPSEKYLDTEPSE